MKNIFYIITARTMSANRTRTIVTILGVILSTAMLTAVAVFGVSIQGYLEQKTVEGEGSWHVAVEGLTAGELKTLGEDERVKTVSLQKEIGYIPGSRDDGSYVRLVSRGWEEWIGAPLEVSEGRMPENEQEILIPYDGVELAGQELSVGDTVTLEAGQFFMDDMHMVPGQVNESQSTGGDEAGEEDPADSLPDYFRETSQSEYKITGVYDNIANAQGVSGFFGYTLVAGPGEELAESAWCDAYIEMEDPRDADRFISDKLEGKEYGSFVSYSRHDSLLRWQGVFRNERYSFMIAGTLGTLFAVIMAGSVLLIYNSFSISLRERTAQFGLLASVGATRRQLRRSLRFEALAVSGAGIPLGLIGGVAGSWVTLRFIGKGLTSFLYGEGEAVGLICPPAVLFFSAALAFVTVLLSAWIPARRAGKVSPMEAVRSLQDVRIRPGQVKSAGLVGRLFGLEGMLAGKNYRRDRKKYRSTVISLTMSIVLFVTASSFMLYIMDAGAVILSPPKYELEYHKILHSGWEEGSDGGREKGAGEAAGDMESLELAREMLDEEALVDSYGFYREGGMLIPLASEDISQSYHSMYYWEELPDGRMPLRITAVILNDADYRDYLETENLEEPKGGDGIIRVIYYDQMRVYDEETKSYRNEAALSEDVKHQSLSAGRMLYTAGEEQDQEQDAGMAEEEFESLFQVVLDQEAGALPAQCQTAVYGPVLILSEEQAGEYESYMAKPLSVGKETSQAVYEACFTIKAENYMEAGKNLREAVEAMPEEMQGTLYTPAEEAAMNRQAVTAIRVLCYGFIVLLTLIAVANVFNTISTNLMLRRREFAMLRSVGMTGKGFRKMMFFECLVYGMRSVVYGGILSAAVSALLWRFTSQAAGLGYIFPLGYFVAAAAGVFAIVLVTMLYTMRKIRKLNIIEELRMN